VLRTNLSLQGDFVTLDYHRGSRRHRGPRRGTLPPPNGQYRYSAQDDYDSPRDSDPLPRHHI
jgi:hypothetical protein